MIRTLSISLALTTLLLAAPAFAADGDCVPFGKIGPCKSMPVDVQNLKLAADGDRLPYPDEGRPFNERRPYNYQIAADGDKLPAPPWQG